MRQIQNLKICVLKQYELLLALHVAYLLEFPSEKEKYDFIEIPNIDYAGKIKKMINIAECKSLIKYIQNFKDESVSINIAIGLDDCYEINERLMDREYIEKYLGYGTLEQFVILLKEFAQKICWDSFFDENIDFYQKIIDIMDNFPKNLDLTDINRFYGLKDTQYTCVLSVLMNGGFGPKDKEENLYYVRGIGYNEKIKKFEIDEKYLCECMFHEFSHPVVNALVDKYFSSFVHIDDIYKEAILNGLPKTYQNKKVLLYEYFVRANANVLVRKYYPDITISEWIKNLGFIYLEKLADYIYQNFEGYSNYEDFFKKELVDFFNDIRK